MSDRPSEATDRGRWVGLTFEHASDCKSPLPSMCAIKGCPRSETALAPEAEAIPRCHAETTIRDDEHKTYQCLLPRGHHGNHESGDITVEWTDATTRPRMLPDTPDVKFLQAVASYIDEWRDGDDHWHAAGHIEQLARERVRPTATTPRPLKKGDFVVFDNEAGEVVEVKEDGYARAALRSGDVTAPIESFVKLVVEGPIRERATDPATVTRLREALAEAREVLGLCGGQRTFGAPEDAEVKAIGKRLGFGALMDAASKGWRESLAEEGWPSGGEFMVGPCRSTVERVLHLIDDALASPSSRDPKETP